MLFGINTYPATTKEKQNLSIENLEVPTTQTMRIIIQFKTFSFSSIIVVDIHPLVYALQNTSPSRTFIYPSANLLKYIYKISKDSQIPFWTSNRKQSDMSIATKKEENKFGIMVRIISSFLISIN